MNYSQTADTLVATSRHKFFGLSVVDAISAGVPPLLPNPPSCPELVPDHLTGFFLYYGDIYESLAPLPVMTRSGLHEHRNVLIQHVESFNWSSLVHDYDDLIDNAAGQIGGQGDPRRQCSLELERTEMGSSGFR
ncbi:MAG: glycosyltransferase [Actinomycetota bacterium]